MAEVQERRSTSQEGLNGEVQERQKALGEDVELLGQKLKEVAALGEAGARAEGLAQGLQEKVVAEVASLQEQIKAAAAEAASERLQAELEMVQEATKQLQGSQTQAREDHSKVIADLQKRDDGLEEQMGSLVMTTAEMMGKLDGLASAEQLMQLRARVDGSLDALLLRLETSRWMREGIDRVADNVTSSFLRLLDDSSTKLSARVDSCEQKLGGRPAR